MKMGKVYVYLTLLKIVLIIIVKIKTNAINVYLDSHLKEFLLKLPNVIVIPLLTPDLSIK